MNPNLLRRGAIYRVTYLTWKTNPIKNNCINSISEDKYINNGYLTAGTAKQPKIKLKVIRMTSNNILSTPYPFLFNKYSTWYFKIIKKAKEQERKKKHGIYYEAHHILPKSMGGQNKCNLILLTGREHFICHWLLTKMMTTRVLREKAIRAFWMMKKINKDEQERYINSRAYDFLKEEYAKIAFSQIKVNSFLGRKHSEESKAKMREAAKGRTFSEETRRRLSTSAKGKKISVEQRIKISNTLRGKKHSPERIAKMVANRKAVVGFKHSPETIAKMIKSKMGHVTSEETKMKISKANSGKKLSEEHKAKISKGLRKRNNES